MPALARWLATLGGVGYLPRIPGTFGTLAGAGFAWWGGRVPSWEWAWVAAATVTALLVAGPAARSFGTADPRPIVIDELCGMAVAVWAIPKSLWALAIGFLWFRLFDVLKPFPIRASERVPHGIGIVLDDLLAGIYANVMTRITLQVLWT